MTPNPIDGRRCAPTLTLAALALAVSAALVSTPAAASGFQLKENSAKALGRAFAGSTAGPVDISVVANNPAAMSKIEGQQFKIDVTAIQLSAEFTGGGTTAAGVPLTGGIDDGGGVIPVPAVFWVTPVGENNHFGVALTVPYGFTSEYDKDWVGRYKAVKSHLQTIDLTFSWSYRFNDSFSLGASAIAQRTSADLTTQVDYGTFLGIPQQADGLARITGDDLKFGWQIGALWKISNADTFALNYHAKVDHTLEGKATFSDVPQQLAALQALGNFINTDGSADFTTPATTTLSYWHQATPRFGFGADLARTEWSSFDELRVVYGSAQADTVEPENWEDTWTASIGADYRLSDNWVLRAGIAYDQTPTQDATRTPRVPDGNRRWLAFGLDYQPSDTLEINVGYAHLWVDDGTIKNDTAETVGATGTTLIGKFETAANLLGVSATLRF